MAMMPMMMMMMMMMMKKMMMIMMIMMMMVMMMVMMMLVMMSVRMMMRCNSFFIQRWRDCSTIIGWAPLCNHIRIGTGFVCTFSTIGPPRNAWVNRITRQKRITCSLARGIPLAFSHIEIYRALTLQRERSPRNIGVKRTA